MMQTIQKQALIIGGGPGGLAAAIALYKQGIRDIVIIEREAQLGGILRQCIHDGFGLKRFGESLTGPEYAARLIDEVLSLQIPYITEATVIDLSAERRALVATKQGLLRYTADAVILTMGCRERTRGALSIPGTRPAGVYTAGVAQAYMNLKNIMVGHEIVILGSGDIGMIMARRLTLEGAHVKAVLEILPYPSGLPRNVEQCLHDYDIPLLLSHTVTEIKGDNRLKAVVVSEVDASLQPISGTEREYPCDTLILSVGLIPENELAEKAGIVLDPRTKGAMVDESYQTSVPGIFAAGNVLHVHDLVDAVSEEAERLAEAVARYLGGDVCGQSIPIQTDETVGYTVPQSISGRQDVTLSLRVKRPMRPCTLEAWQDGRCIATQTYQKAIPAEMRRITLSKEQLRSYNPIKVVAHVE